MKTLSFLFITLAFAQQARALTELHEYSSHSYPIDPRNVFTISDYRVSEALGAGLVKFGADGTITAQLADRWQVDPTGSIEFHLRPNAKWSDGSKLTAKDVAASFAYDIKYNTETHSDELNGFASVEVLSEDRLLFHAKPGITAVSLLPKFTEPTVGIVRIINGKADLSVSSGPYVLASDDGKETLLKANRHWVKYSQQMIEQIRLRRSMAVLTPLVLVQDPWPDLVYLGTGVLKADLAKLPADTPIWRLNHDRLLAINWTGRGGDVASARLLIGYLRAHGNLSAITSQLEEVWPAAQIYPKGNVLHGDADPKPSTVTREEFLRRWKYKDVRVAYVEDRMHPEMARLAEKTLREALPVKLKFIGIKSKDSNKMEHSHTNDLFLASLTVDPDDIDGDLSGLIETPPTQIPSDKSDKGNFRARLNAARQSTNPLPLFRQILVDAVEGNYYLPVAFFSSAVVGRPAFSFDQLPKFGDIAPYSAIRLKAQSRELLTEANE